MLLALEVDAIPLRQKFSETIDDVDLFPQLQEFDVFITGDMKQITRTIEAEELKRAKVTSLWLEPFFNKMQFWDQAAWIIRKWHLIESFAQSATKGTAAMVKHSGRCQPFQL